jgi:hypothetical protein
MMKIQKHLESAYNDPHLLPPDKPIRVWGTIPGNNHFYSRNFDTFDEAIRFCKKKRWEYEVKTCSCQSGCSCHTGFDNHCQ